MDHLNVNIELKGIKKKIGQILCDDPNEPHFIYDKEYLESPEAAAISLSLPLQEEAFPAHQTKNYFEGLLPEGFSRKSVADWMRVDENDYISILLGLGRECLGAVQISSELPEEPASYESLSRKQVRALASEGATKSAQLVTEAHLSLTGASGKIGLYYEPGKKAWFLPKGTAPSTHIVKQSHIRYSGIVVNEKLSLLTGEALDIETPESFIVAHTAADDEEVLFATRRYDRTFENAGSTIDGLLCPLRLHQEDLAQAMGIPAMQKYESSPSGYMKSMFEILRRYSSNPVEDQLRLWRIIVFDFLVGNTDNHIKNYSLLYGDDLKSVRLAPAYDIVSTVTYEGTSRNMAFFINEKSRLDDLREEDFRNAASECGLGEKMAMRQFEQLCSGFEKALKESARMLKEQGFPQAAQLQKRILKYGGFHNLS